MGRVVPFRAPDRDLDAMLIRILAEDHPAVIRPLRRGEPGRLAEVPPEPATTGLATSDLPPAMDFTVPPIRFPVGRALALFAAALLAAHIVMTAMHDHNAARLDAMQEGAGE